MSVATSTAIAIAGAAAAGTSLVSSHMASNSAERQGQATAASEDKQLAYLIAKEKQDQQNWEATAAENRRQFDSTQRLNVDQYNRKETRLSPYRSIGAGATGTLADLMGIRLMPVAGGASMPPPTAPSSSTSQPAARPVAGTARPPIGLDALYARMRSPGFVPTGVRTAA